MHKTLLIGTGYRIQNNFIPAFRCLPGQFALTGVHSRNPENVKKVSNRWAIPPVFSLSDVDLGDFDAVAISIPPQSVASVVEKLEGASHLRVLLDTPALCGMPERTKAFLKSCRKVLVAEDYANFAKFGLMRDVVESGALGRITHINLYHSGYLYHGAALIRALLGFRKPWLACSFRISPNERIYLFFFRGGARACMVEPYRRSSGHVEIFGTKGRLSDFPSMPEGAIVSEVRDKGTLVGYETQLEGKTFRKMLRFREELRAFDFDDKIEFNDIRNSSLAEIMEALACESSGGFHYDIEEGLFDDFITRFRKWTPFSIRVKLAHLLR